MLHILVVCTADAVFIWSPTHVSTLFRCFEIHKYNSHSLETHKLPGQNAQGRLYPEHRGSFKSYSTSLRLESSQRSDIRGGQSRLLEGASASRFFPTVPSNTSLGRDSYVVYTF